MPSGGIRGREKNSTPATAIIANFGEFFLRILPFRLIFVKMAVASGRIAN